MTTIYVSGLQQFTRARLRVPGPSTTLQQLMEVFCKEQRLGNAASFVFCAFVARPAQLSRTAHQQNCNF